MVEEDTVAELAKDSDDERRLIKMERVVQHKAAKRQKRCQVDAVVSQPPGQSTFFHCRVANISDQSHYFKGPGVAEPPVEVPGYDAQW